MNTKETGATAKPIICYNCTGQGKVFPGVPGFPRTVDTSQIVTCPVCKGSGYKDFGQLSLLK